MEFAPRQGWFQQVGRVHGPLATTTRANKRVNFVDKQHDFAIGVGHLFDYRLEPFFKLTLIFGTRHQQAHVERHNDFGLQVFGNIALHNTLGKPFDNGCFANTGFTNQHGVIFGSAAQNLEHSPNFFVSSDYGVNFTRAGSFVEVHAVSFQRLIRCFCVLVFHRVIFSA